VSKFRKKPVVIDAEQYTGAGIYPQGVTIPRAPDGVEFKTFDITWDRYPIVRTLEGEHNVSPGDWIITGVKGEKYPCKPDIFALTYEAVQS
jgi:hypothetical protein